MKRIGSILSFGLATLVVVVAPSSVRAEVALSPPDSTGAWLGFMSVFDLQADGGGAVFGQYWGVSDLAATFNDPTTEVTLSPNTIDDPNEFWYQDTSGTATSPNFGGPGQLGNKLMEAALFIEETGPLAGQDLTFSVDVNAYDLTSAHQASLYIRDFAPDYSSFVDTFVPITGTGTYTASLTTIDDPARHVHYGYQLVGQNVWVTDVAPFGSVTIGPSVVPEPGSFALVGLAAAGLVAYRRRR